MKESPLVHVRLNVEKEKTGLHVRPWRVMTGESQFLADEVKINIRSWTSGEDVAPAITCRGRCYWSKGNSVCTIM